MIEQTIDDITDINIADDRNFSPEQAISNPLCVIHSRNYDGARDKSIVQSGVRLSCNDRPKFKEIRQKLDL